MKYHIEVLDVVYSVTDEDVCSEIDNDPTIVKNSEEYYSAIQNKIAEIKNQLPTRMSFDIECDNIYDLEDLVCDYITEKTGWLVYVFNYHYKKVPVALKDYFGRTVKPGDKVVLLCKAYGFRGIKRAFLAEVTYKGKGQWGHEFDWTNRHKWEPLIRIREPECIKVSKKGCK